MSYSKERAPMRLKTKKGFTLVELLVVIAIIGVLVALLLPAIQAAREAARRNSCKNKLKQLALGCLNHESNVGYLPSGGWNSRWVGDGDRGSGASQPGSWIYSLLPYIEQKQIFDLTADGDPNGMTGAVASGGVEALLRQPFDTIHCPSRGQFGLHKDATLFPTVPFVLPAGTVEEADYAANFGDRGIWQQINGSAPPNAGAVADFTGWLNTKIGQMNSPGAVIPRPTEYWANTGDPEPGLINGVIFSRSEIKFRNITDGTTKTYLIGERWQLSAGIDPEGVDSIHPWAVGPSDNSLRTTAHQPMQNAPLTKEQMDAIRDQEPSGTSQPSYRFGSPHASGLHMAFCDGHVETINYDIDIFVHQTQGNRTDGQVIQQ